MCQRVQCPSCGKPTFAGCGRHVEQVLGDVPVAERCQCRATAQAGDGAGPRKSILDWILGR
ncbi:MAG TPA: hypothetical protein VGI39_08575 [Polyangiaceae bacterium]|jgi:hypothetical protein